MASIDLSMSIMSFDFLYIGYILDWVLSKQTSHKSLARRGRRKKKLQFYWSRQFFFVFEFWNKLFKIVCFALSFNDEEIWLINSLCAACSRWDFVYFIDSIVTRMTKYSFFPDLFDNDAGMSFCCMASVRYWINRGREKERKGSRIVRVRWRPLLITRKRRKKNDEEEMVAIDSPG